MFHKQKVVGIFLILGIFFPGCKKKVGPPSADIRIKITYKGEPVPGAELKFFPKTATKENQENNFPVGFTGSDGSLVTTGAPVGDFILVVDNRILKNVPAPYDMKEMLAYRNSENNKYIKEALKKKAELPQGKKALYKEIPSKYYTRAHSDIFLTLKDGTNDFGTIELKD